MCKLYVSHVYALHLSTAAHTKRARRYAHALLAAALPPMSCARQPVTSFFLKSFCLHFFPSSLSSAVLVYAIRFFFSTRGRPFGRLLCERISILLCTAVGTCNTTALVLTVHCRINCSRRPGRIAFGRVQLKRLATYRTFAATSTVSYIPGSW